MTKKILIIDDDKIFSKVLRDSLTSKNGGGYEVINAHDGEDGFEKAKKEHPNLIILDLMMPNIGGIDFLKKMKSENEFPDTPILISSQISDIDKISEGMELGIKGYILKANYSLDGIVEKINDILQEK